MLKFCNEPTCLLISCFLSYTLLRLYANYYGNQSCGYDYQLSTTSFMLIISFVTISSNLEQKVTLACEQTCYTRSTEGAAYGIIAVSCSTFACQNSKILDSVKTLHTLQKQHQPMLQKQHQPMLQKQHQQATFFWCSHFVSKQTFKP